MRVTFQLGASSVILTTQGELGERFNKCKKVIDVLWIIRENQLELGESPDTMNIEIQGDLALKIGDWPYAQQVEALAQLCEVYYRSLEAVRKIGGKDVSVNQFREDVLHKLGLTEEDFYQLTYARTTIQTG